MSYPELKILIGGLIIVDVAIVVIFIFLVRKLKDFGERLASDKEIGQFESLIADSSKIASALTTQLESKHQLIKGLNEELDNKISGLNLLLNRADARMPGDDRQGGSHTSPPVDPAAKQAAVLSLAKKGRSAAEIEKALSIAKGEAKLILELDEKLSRLRNEGAS
ncbi:MAG: hypothetical protein V3S89_07030 [Desulfobacterales bacterium]